MLSNLHTHTVFCDGEHTVNQVVLSAIEKGFDSLGFSGHGYTGFDLTYCMKDTEGYIAAVTAAKQQFGNQLEIYLGVEEDAFSPLKNRKAFDYIIGSSHYFHIEGVYYAIDSSPAGFEKCVSLFNGDVCRLAETYYAAFCDYLSVYKPDIIGHFDLITKFAESDTSPRLLDNPMYRDIATHYLKQAMKTDCLFEVNTGAVSRGYRTTPYPSVDLLHTLKENGGKVILSSDSHQAETLDYHFSETRALLKDIGFLYVYVLSNGSFVKDYL